MQTTVSDCAPGFFVSGFPGMHVVPTEPATDVHARIASVGKLILRESWRFWRSLPPRSQGQFGVDDLVQECWALLLHEDDTFDPERFPSSHGYAMFACLVLRRRLQSIRGKARIVQTPQGAKSITRDRPHSQTAMRILAAGRRVEHTVPETIPSNDPLVLDQIIDNESASIAKRVVSGAMAHLEHRDSLMLQAHYGIGSLTQSREDLANGFGFSDLRGLWAHRRKAENRLAAILCNQGMI